MWKANYTCDLHTHSTRSDGAYTPPELIRNGAAAGLKVVALTDHDKVPQALYEDEIQSVDLRELASSLGVTLLLGTEISCETDVEDVHMICLGCDWKAPWFQQMEAAVAQSRIKGYRELLLQLQQDGVSISWEEVLNNEGNPIEERSVLKKTIFELLAKKGFADSWSQAKIIIKNTERYQIKREKPDPLEVIKHVHRAGGIVLLAHPFLIADEVCVRGKKKTQQQYIEELLLAGLDGIEACYPYEKTSYEGDKSSLEMETYIRKTYENRVAILSGGSDYHGEEKKGSKNPRKLGECGVTESYFYENPLLSRLANKDSALNK